MAMIRFTIRFTVRVAVRVAVTVNTLYGLAHEVVHRAGPGGGSVLGLEPCHQTLASGLLVISVG